MLIRNGKVFSLKEKGFVKKDILIEGSKIKLIADFIDGDGYIDATGKYIMPGLIEAHSHIGLWEEGIGWEGEDGSEESSPIMPALRAIDSINPFDIAFKEALSGGVTVACTGPGSGNVFSGQFSIIRLHGNIIDEMIIKEYAAMKCSFGENPKSTFGKSKNAPMTRMGIAYLMRKTLLEAKNYKYEKENAIKENKYFEIDLDKEAFIPILNKEVPLKAHVHRADDICSAIRIAKEFDLDLTLDHCTEGQLIIDYLKKNNYPIIVGPSFGSKSKIEINKKSYKTPGILNKAGLKVALTTDHNVMPQESLNMCAAMAVREGMDEFEALKSITINPAEILKIDNIKGKIEEGMDADLSVWSNHPLEINSKVEAVFIEGKDVYKLN
ncbi:MAG: amidohydrolase family protein [Peptostreptococcaceae bacterium]